MDCTKCTGKGCRSSEPCMDRSPEYIMEYRQEESQNIVLAASSLVDDGRAGTLNRLEEIIEYAKGRGYRKLGVAYCYGLEEEAALLQKNLSAEGFQTVMVSCTVDGVCESKINSQQTKPGISCNPIGQAHAINQGGAEFTILMGLCLGHDILIQKRLKMDFTTWLVKDRVTGHRPLDGLPGHLSGEDLFLKNMDGTFRLIGREQAVDKMQKANWEKDLAFLDLRGREAFLQNGIPGSSNCLLNNLPDCHKELFPDKGQEIIVYCNGGMQSIYAVMYLTLKGYGNVKSLAGGYGDGSWAIQTMKG